MHMCMHTPWLVISKKGSTNSVLLSSQARDLPHGCVCVFVCVCLHVCEWVCVFVCVWLRVCEYVCVFMHACLCALVWMLKLLSCSRAQLYVFARYHTQLYVFAIYHTQLYVFAR